MCTCRSNMPLLRRSHVCTSWSRCTSRGEVLIIRRPRAERGDRLPVVFRLVYDAQRRDAFGEIPQRHLFQARAKRDANFRGRRERAARDSTAARSPARFAASALPRARRSAALRLRFPRLRCAMSGSFMGVPFTTNQKAFIVTTCIGGFSYFGFRLQQWLLSRRGQDIEVRLRRAQPALRIASPSASRARAEGARAQASSPDHAQERDPRDQRRGARVAHRGRVQGWTVRTAAGAVAMTDDARSLLDTSTAGSFWPYYVGFKCANFYSALLAAAPSARGSPSG